MDKKISCKCKKHGCAHFTCGFCRLKKNTGPKSKRTDTYSMRIPTYHYLCCPFLNSAQGKEALAVFMKEYRSVQS